MKITRMKTNRIQNPLGFDLQTPSVSWTVCETEAKKQAAARVEVSERPDFSAPAFDTGWSEALSSLGVKLTFPLKPRTRYFWRVSVKNERGETAVSDSAWFETGKMDEPLLGIPISPKLADNVAPYFRKRFILPGRVQRARAYFTGLGIYELYVNGKKAGEEFLAPGCTVYDSWLQLQTYDVTDLLQEGENVIGAIVGNGWAKGRFCFGSEAGSYETNDPGSPADHFTREYLLLGELRVSTDRGEVSVATDETWQCAPCPLTFGNIYDGERYEQALEIEDWASPECAFRNWCGVKRNTATRLGEITDRLSLPVVVRHRLVPKRIESPKGELLLDLGQNITGWLTFTADLPAGTELRLQFGELLQDGCFYRDNLRSALAEYRFLSDGRRGFLRPIATFYGFRFVKFSGIDTLEGLEGFEAWALYSDLEATGEIVTGSEKVNRLFQNSLWSQRDNFLDVPTDCPQRDERMGWTGDAQVFCPTANYNMDCRAFYAKYMKDLLIEQRKEDGRVPDVAPVMVCGSYRRTHPVLSGGGRCGWADAAAIIPWETYLACGDPTVLEDGYESMKRWADWIYRYDEAHGGTRLWPALEFQFADWLALDGPESGFRPNATRGGTDETFLCSAYYYKSTCCVRDAARVLGNAEDAAVYEKRADEILRAIRREYYTPGGLCAAATQTGNALSLVFGLAPKSAREKVLTSLRSLLFQNRMRLKTGFLGTPALCRALSENGANEDAYTLFLSEKPPGWLYEVNLGATTIWERWDSVKPDGKVSGAGMNSMNHYAYGAVFEWVYKDVCGLNPVAEAPGYKRALLRPMPDARLGEALAVVETAAGRYESGWKYEGERVHYRFVVPFDAEAQIVLTGPDGETLRETVAAGVHTYVL